MCKLWKVVSSRILLSLFLFPHTYRSHLGDFSYLGHAMAEVISCYLALQRPVFNTRPVCEGFVVDKGTQS